MTPADDHATVDKQQQRKIQRQRTLSLGKAIEISLKSIKVRFWRSLITMSGIILAIAFLMSIWTSTAILEKLRSLPEEDEDKAAVDLLLQKKGVDTVQDQLKTLVIGEPSAGKAALSQQDKSPYAVLLKDYAKQLRIITIAPSNAKLAEAIAESDCVIVDRVLPELTNPLVVEKLAGLVSEGGAVLVVGTPQVGDVRKTAATRQDPKKLLQQLLPVAAAGSTGDTGKVQPKRHSVTRDIQWKNYPKLKYHTASISKGAKVLVTVGNKAPLMAVKRYGKGYVMAYVAEDAGLASHAAWSSGSTLVGQSLLWLTRERRGGVGAKNTWLIVLSLLVCVVGIVNSMLMSVSERVREIGTMKCLGALDRFIVKLFLLESSFQGVIGTLVGLVLGFVLSFIRALFSYFYADPTTEKWHFFALEHFPALVIAQSAFWAFLIGSLLSIGAAIYPAYGAAKMQPVDAMRVDE